MPSYCLLADLQTYLNVTTSSEEGLLQLMLDAATNRIDSRCARSFQAAGDTTRTYDPTRDVIGRDIWINEDLSYITSIVNGDSVNVTSECYHQPRNVTPYYLVGFKQNSGSFWTYNDTPEDAISITGRWAYMERANITALSRSAGSVVTATVVAPRLSVGMSVFVLGVADSSFNGTFTVTANNGATITWAQTGAVDTDTTGVLLFTPTDIVTACRRLAAWMYRQKDTQSGDTDRPLLAGDGTVIMPTTLPLDVEKLLQPYLRRL
jgi:hypothetical protein